MEISKSDWKLFRACIAEWQENYMERLVKEYIDMLNAVYYQVHVPYAVYR